MSTWLPLIFKLLVALVPIFTGIATHNYSVPVPANQTLAVSVARPVLTHGMALGAVASFIGAFVTHRKITEKTSATIPHPIGTPAEADDLEKIMALLWGRMGPGAPADQVKAIQELRTAMGKKTP